jgi:nitrite reductase/ring-hydroxylating ferredoxin subunit
MMGKAPELTGPDFSVGMEVSRIPENIPLLGHANGAAVILVRKGSTFHALGATCSHYSGPLADGLIVGQTVRCPWHHACFDLHTGEALGAPALDPIPCYEVIRRDDRVSVGAKKSPAPVPVPPESPAKIVIAGAGAAGAAAAEKLRRLGFTGAITLIGNEAPGPVDRPNLSKDFLAGTAPMEWVTLRDDAFYEKLEIEFIKEAIAELEPTSKSIKLEGGRTVAYDKLLLATGSEPVREMSRWTWSAATPSRSGTFSGRRSVDSCSVCTKKRAFGFISAPGCGPSMPMQSSSKVAGSPLISSCSVSV